MRFATINGKQTRVTPSLVYDLFAETTSRSPQKTSHDICRLLNYREDSPLFHWIKPLGRKTDEFRGVITQATFAKSLISLISKNPESIRDTIRRRYSLDQYDEENEGRPFWKYFKAEKDHIILRVMRNYFSAVASVFDSDWVEQKGPIGRAIGFRVLMRILDKLCAIGVSSGTLSVEFFKVALSDAASLQPLTFEAYPASGAGESKLYKAIEERLPLLNK